MAFERRQYSGNAIPTTVPAGLGTSETSIAMAASTGWPDGSVGPSFATIDQNTATEERIKYTGRTANTLTGVTRGADGTAAASHVANAPIIHSHSKTDLDEANQHYFDTTLNHHTQYQLNSDVRKLTIQLAADGVAVRLGSASDTNALNVSPYGPAAVVYASGAEFDGTNSTARASSATQIEQLNATVNMYVDTTLTSGNTYSRTKILAIDGSGLQLGSAVSVPGGSPFTIRIANTGNVPTGTPTNGGWLWVEGGALKFKGTSATVTTLAPA